jgi:hypothetical protein
MRAALNLAGGLVWFVLQAIVITRLLRGEWRRYPLIFVFVISEFLVGVAQVPTNLSLSFHQTAAAQSWSATVYERGEVFLEFFTFVVVISLIFRATAHLQSRGPMRVICVAGAALFVGTSFWIHFNPRVGVGLWMTPWTRDLNFGTSILDLALWSLLMTQRRKDSRLLLLSGALGIQFAGSAIAHSLRTLATPHHIGWLSMMGGKLVVVSSLFRVYLWARAFRPAPLVTGKGLALDVPSEPG